METPLVKTVMLAVSLVVLTAVLMIVAQTIVLGNGIGSQAAEGIQGDMEHIKTGVLWELSQSGTVELPTAAAYNLIEHHKSSIGALHCTGTSEGCCGTSHTFGECMHLLTDVGNEKAVSGICLVHHMTSRVKMTIVESERFYGLYDVMIEPI